MSDLFDKIPKNADIKSLISAEGMQSIEDSKKKLKTLKSIRDSYIEIGIEDLELNRQIDEIEKVVDRLDKAMG